MRLLNKRSNVTNKKPKASDLEYGELAINYTNNQEELFIKNSENNVIGLLGKKQDKLISGTNIKLINNQNILGNGNLDILPNITYEATTGRLRYNNSYISPNLKADSYVVYNHISYQIEESSNFSGETYYNSPNGSPMGYINLMSESKGNPQGSQLNPSIRESIGGGVKVIKYDIKDTTKYTFIKSKRSGGHNYQQSIGYYNNEDRFIYISNSGVENFMIIPPNVECVFVSYEHNGGGWTYSYGADGRAIINSSNTNLSMGGSWQNKPNSPHEYYQYYCTTPKDGYPNGQMLIYMRRKWFTLQGVEADTIYG